MRKAKDESIIINAAMKVELITLPIEPIKIPKVKANVTRRKGIF